MSDRDKIELIKDFKELGLRNAKQLEFVNDYIFSKNITQSGVLVGYSKSYAQTNLGKVLEETRIKTYIENKRTELYEILESEKIADKKELLEILTKIARNEETEEVVVGTEFGPEKVTKDVSVKDRNKAIELLGKHYGAWQENVNVNTQMVVIDDDL